MGVKLSNGSEALPAMVTLEVRSACCNVVFWITTGAVDFDLGA
jgi:hypothetical protein